MKITPECQADFAATQPWDNLSKQRTEETASIRVQHPDQDSTRKHRRWWRYGPLVVWAALIFIGSSDLLSGSNTGGFLLGWLRWLFPSASEATFGAIHYMIRKAGHLAEYAVLAMLAARAFRASSYELIRRHWFLASLLLAAIYSLSDELHQRFVPTRGASIYDCLIDTLGGLIGLLIVWWWRQRVTRKASQRAPAIKAGAAI